MWKELGVWIGCLLWLILGCFLDIKFLEWLLEMAFKIMLIAVLAKIGLAVEDIFDPTLLRFCVC